MAINILKEYNRFIENYPNYAKLIESYEYLDKDGLKFIFKNGQTGYYYPLVARGRSKKSKVKRDD